jgi:pyruvate,orthophosphate dikinase
MKPEEERGVEEGKQKWVYEFSRGTAEGDASMKDILGGKGANLAEMSRIGLPVPPGFTVSSEACRYYFAHEGRKPEDLAVQVEDSLKNLEEACGRVMGDVSCPLLVSVRSGSRVSMPGMMDTVLNLGLNDDSVRGLASDAQDERFAYDSYRRFIQMYGDVVLGVDHASFERLLGQAKSDEGVYLDKELSSEVLKRLVLSYKALVEEKLSRPFPSSPFEQLWGAIEAVFNSWHSPRAKVYRRLNGYSDDWGTAVTVQAMVFGNMGEDCGTGVAFTRDPSTGENRFYGDYLLNAQGEDVVAGIRTPLPLTKASREDLGASGLSLEEELPEVYEDLEGVRRLLEKHYGDMQDIEFTIERGKLYLLQTRSGKRSARAALKIAIDFVGEGIISKEDALMRIDALSLNQILHPVLDEKGEWEVIGRGLPASPGAACGKLVFSADRAEQLASSGDKVILVRPETSPEDVHGMYAAQGIITTRGGRTSHAAVVARGMGRACIVAISDMDVDLERGELRCHGLTLVEGDVITMDGSSGEVMKGEVDLVTPDLSGDFKTIMEWSDGFRKMKVRANAETVLDAKVAVDFGCEGIGLCRTEHMFFEGERIHAMHRMIMSSSVEGRKKALYEIEEMQTRDFEDLFMVMEGRPLTIRLFDPPLHEFLPHTDRDIRKMVEITDRSLEEVKKRVEQLREMNPMLGHRGCRLLVSYPEIIETQARAIFYAMRKVYEGTGGENSPDCEVMIPLVGDKGEFEEVAKVVKRIGDEVMKDLPLEYKVGTMIELPRAALLSDEIGEVAEFFSFGTNDLTQTTYGLSRDDSSSFMGDYERLGLMSQDPFQTIDRKGVGRLMSLAVEGGRKVRPDIKLGICGEHGGDPSSIAFCEEQGLDYVSCSPYRVPVARLAAAQSRIMKLRQLLTSV